MGPEPESKKGKAKMDNATATAINRLAEMDAAREAAFQAPIDEDYESENPFSTSPEWDVYDAAQERAARAVLDWAAGRWGIHNIVDAYRVIYNSRRWLDRHLQA